MSAERGVAAAAAVVLFVAAAFFARRAARRSESVVDPLIVMLVAWAVALAFFAIPWIRYTPTRAIVWLILYASIACFAIGALMARRVVRGHTIAAPAEAISPSRLRLIWLAAVALGLIGFGNYLYTLHGFVGLNALIHDLERVRAIQLTREFQDSYGIAKTLTYFNAVALLLWTVGLRLGAFRGWWSVAAPIGAVTIVQYFFAGDRLSLSIAGIFTLVFHLVWRPVTTLRRVLVVSVPIALFFVAFFFVIAAQKNATVDNHPEIRKTLTTNHLDDFVMPYLYLSANVPEFSQLASDPIAPRTYGQLTVLPLVKLAHLLTPLPAAPPTAGRAFYPIPFDTYNSTTWLGAFYLDFGLAGCLVLPLLFGFLATYAMLMARRKGTLLWVWTAAVGLYVTTFSPLVNKLPDAITWQLLLLGPVVTTLIAAGSPRARVERFLSRVSRPGVQRVAIVGLLGFVAAVSVAAHVTAKENPGNQRDAVQRDLREAASRLRRVRHYQRNLTSWALASQLEASHPIANYEAMSWRGTPSKPGVIGVFVDRTGVLLRARTDTGEVLEVISATDGTTSETFGPRSLSRHGLLVDGGFEDPLKAPWVVDSPPGVRMSRTRFAGEGAYAIEVQFTGRRTGAAVLTQRANRLPTRNPRSTYILSALVFGRGVSKEVVVAFRLHYRDRTHQDFAATVTGTGASTSRAPGIPRGDTGGWLRVRASGVASRFVERVEVFAIYAHPGVMRGRVFVDDVSLKIDPRPAIETPGEVAAGDERS